jgi:uncharacterized protein (TIGR02246 family)
MAENEAANRAIQEIVHQLKDGWNRHDAAVFAAPFAEDADFTNVFGVVAKGRARVESSHAVIFRTLFRDSRWTESNVNIRFLRPDVANVDIRWIVTGAYDPEGRPVPVRQGLMNLIVTEEHGRWAIAVFHNQDLPAPERAKTLADLWNDKMGQ